MPSRFDKRKACIHCANAKRSCDKALPGCQRCLDRDVDCHYPQPKRRRVVCQASSTRVSTALAEAGHWPQPATNGDTGLVIESEALDSLVSSLVDENGWNTATTPDHAFHLAPADTNKLNGGMEGLFPMMSSTIASMEEPTSGTQSFFKDTPLLPWFLQPDSWALHQSNHDPGCVSDIELEPLIEHIRRMLQTWLGTGHNQFIHRKLYPDALLPGCLQDAYLTLSAYTHRTPETRNMVIQIAEARLVALVEREHTPITSRSAHEAGQSTAAEVLHRLARVQALFTHLFIHLFDGSVRQRSKAEKHLPLLRAWVREMYAVAQRFRGADNSSRGGSSIPDLVAHADTPITASGSETNVILEENNFDCSMLLAPSRQWAAATVTEQHQRQPRVIWHFNPATLAAEQTDNAMQDLWRSWIIAESVRRTYTVVDTTINLHQKMTQGCADCQGGLLFTARKGAWDADSAVRWARIVGISGDSERSGGEEEVPLLVPGLRPEQVMAQCSVMDVDEFAIICWTFIVGREKINGWVERSGGRS